MLPRGLTRRFLLFGIPALAILVALAACEDEEAAAPTATPTPTPQAIDISNVPELQDGTLLIGSDITYPPMESYDANQNPVGMDIDLAKAMAAVLGVEVEFQQVGSFEGIVGDLKAKRYDIIMSSIFITPERETEIDFVAYFGPVGTGILVEAGNPEGIADLDDLCGRPVAAQLGTYQVDQMEAANTDICADNKIDIKAFPDNPTAVQELTLGRVDAELADDPVTAYSAATSEGQLVEVAATQIEAAVYGIGVRKDSPELKAVLEQALQAIIADGTYLEVLQTWEQEQFAIE